MGNKGLRRQAKQVDGSRRFTADTPKHNVEPRMPAKVWNKEGIMDDHKLYDVDRTMGNIAISSLLSDGQVHRKERGQKKMTDGGKKCSA